MINRLMREKKLLEAQLRDANNLADQWAQRNIALESERERLADALDRQSAITGDHIARCQRLADELAITRRVIDRIGQLCTTPHESKERFIRRVQSVIEWERAGQQDQSK
ncbi:hypothetical protein ACF8C6_08830 [Pseudomonas sp. zbq_18]|uniref:hypothetical protein n=1 Tax=Pseudomonas sp. zbq_18 TaxID=3367251 RepID=UPI00370CD188